MGHFFFRQAASPEPVSVKTGFKSVIINFLLVAASLSLSLVLSEFLLGKYEAHLLKASHVDPENPYIDNWMFDVMQSNPDQFNIFKWQEDGNNLIHIKSGNPRLVYELRPGAKIDDLISINSEGFRDEEFSKEKGADVFRILVIGDSITFGWDQRIENTYPKLLEKELNRDAPEGRRYEVYNMGIAGYNAEQELEVLRNRAFDFSPDLIIIGFCVNDIAVGADGGLWRHFTRGPLRTWDFLKLQAMRIREYFRDKDLVVRNYEAIAGLCDEKNVPVMVVVFPSHWLRENKNIRILCERLGMPVLDLYESFNSAGLDKTLNNIHPTTLGHEIAAEEIRRFLTEETDLLNWRKQGQAPT